MLGKTVKDKITGFSGVVTGTAEYITGCKQALVQPPMKDGDFVESRWLDYGRLECDANVDVVILNGEENGPDKPAPSK